MGAMLPPPKAFMRLNELEILSLLDFFDVRSLIQFSRTSKRFYLCSNDVMARSSGMVSTTVQSVSDVLNLVKRLQSPPNILVAFSSNSRGWNKKPKSHALQNLCTHLPPQCALLYADHYAVQQGREFQDEDTAAAGGSDGALVVTLGAFPEAVTGACLLTNAQCAEALGDADSPAPSLVDALLAAVGMNPALDWRVFIVNICPKALDSHKFVTALTKRYPQASIIGGVCNTALTATFHGGNFVSTLGDAQLGRDAAFSVLALGMSFHVNFGMPVNGRIYRNDKS